MPKAKKQDRGEFTIEQVSLNAMASVLGVAQNTILEWRDDGAPLILMPCLWILWAIQHRTPTAVKQGWMRWCTKLGIAAPDDDDTDEKGEPKAKLPGKCAYDGRVSKPVSYADALQREKVIGELMGNDIKRREAELVRKNLWTREQVEQRDRAYDEVVIDHITTVQALIQEVVPPEKRPAAQAKAKAWIAETRKKIAEAAR